MSWIWEAANTPTAAALQWLAVALIAVVGWLILSIVFFLPYLGVAWLTNLSSKGVGAAATTLFASARTVWEGVSVQFEKLADPNNLSVLLVGKIDETRAFAERALKGLKRERKKHEKRGAMGERDVLARVRNAMGRLDKVQPIELDDDQASKLSGRAMAWVRAILFTILAVAIVLVNTFLLNEFFKGFFPQYLPVLGIQLGLVFSIMYTFVELGFGFTLERINEKREEEGRQGVGAMQLVLVSFIIVAVAVEVVLYALLSFEIRWPWPEEVAAALPWWMDGWLGGMGLLIGGGVCVMGYAMGDQWADVLRRMSVATIKKRTEVLNRTINALPQQVRDINSALDRTPAAAPADGSAPRSSGMLDSQISRLEESLNRLSGAEVAGAAPAVGRHATAQRWLAPVLAGAGVLMAAGVIVQQAISLSNSDIAEWGWWAPLFVAFLVSVALLIGGFLARPRFLGHGVGPSRQDGGQLHVEGVPMNGWGWLGVAIGLFSLAFGVWIVLEDFPLIDLRMLALTIILSLVMFGLGFVVESIGAGLAFMLNALFRGILASLIALVGVLVSVMRAALWILQFTARLIAAPAVFLMRILAPNLMQRLETAAREIEPVANA
ncbi:MAG: hypothetical protein ACOYJ6_17860 [Caulobacterales bacterium]|jgi:hypothetical protein